MASDLSNSRRVVITGMGIVCPLGMTLAQVWQRLQSGASGIVNLHTETGVRYPFPFGATVREFTGDLEEFGISDPLQKKQVRKGLKLMCREIQMGVAATQRAIDDAGLVRGCHAPERMGVSFGSDHIVATPQEFESAFRACCNGSATFDIRDWGVKGFPEVTPLWLLKYLPNMPASHVAILYDLRGPNNSITHREVSGGLAIGEAAAIIRRDAADAVVVGATGSSLQILRAIQTSFLGEIVQDDTIDPAESCRPFDVHRQGMVPGEGSAVLVLESEASARARGKKPYGEVWGHGSSCAIVNRVPDMRTAVGNAVRAAIGRISPDLLPGHIHAHGLGTHDGDLQEAAGIVDALGPRGKNVPVVAAKAYFGNLGAAGELVQIVTSLLAMREGVLFSNRNLDRVDPNCPLNLTRQPAEPAGASVLSVSYSPNGQASAVWVGTDAPFHR